MTARHTLAVVFDLDGTLVDTMTSAPQAYADTIRSLGGPDVSPSDVVAVWHIGPTPVVLEHFLGRPVSLPDTERFHRHFADVVASVEPFRVWSRCSTHSAGATTGSASSPPPRAEQRRAC